MSATLYLSAWAGSFPNTKKGQKIQPTPTERKARRNEKPSLAPLRDSVLTAFGNPCGEGMEQPSSPCMSPIWCGLWCCSCLNTSWRSCSPLWNLDRNPWELGVLESEGSRSLAKELSPV